MQHSSGFRKICDDAKKEVSQITLEETQAKQASGEELILIDVREDNEWDKEHLPNAIHIGKGVIERDIEKTVPDQSAMLVLYCGGGSRSALAALNLQKMGYTNVHSMIGGFRGWKATQG